MAKLYTRLKINETYRAANTDDLADLGGFSVALKKGQVSYSVTIYVDGKLVKTEKNVFNAKGESIDHWHEFEAKSFKDAASRMTAFWQVFIGQHRVWFNHVKQLFDHSIQSGRSPQSGGGSALWSVANIAMSKAHSMLSKQGQVNQREVIISNESEILLIVGTEQHSPSYGNKLMFPAQAVREVRQNYGNHKHVTIIIFTDGFTAMELSLIKRDAKALNALVYFKKVNTTRELINYINNGDATIKRDNLKIGTIKIFSHGLPSILDFGLDGVNSKTQQFTISNVAELKINSFMDKSFIFSYACRTGNSDGGTLALMRTSEMIDKHYSNNWKELVRPEKSLAQVLSDHLNAKVYAYLKRSNYTSSWSDHGDKSYNRNNTTIVDESAGTFRGALSRIRDRKEIQWDEALWNPAGAYAAPTSGTTPTGLPSGMYVFEKGKDPRPE